MTQATISKKINRTTGEIQDLIKISKRKLLELEVLLNLVEIRKGNFEIIKKVNTFLKKLK